MAAEVLVGGPPGGQISPEISGIVFSSEGSDFQKNF